MHQRKYKYPLESITRNWISMQIELARETVALLYIVNVLSVI